MTRRNIQFEVQVLQKNHWVIDSVQTDEDSAVAYAKAQVTQGRVEGAKVIKQWKRNDGAVVESEIYSQLREISARLTITTVESAPLCSDIEDYYKIDSRIVLGRVLRSYLEQVVVTPTEIMHHYGELKRLQDKDNLLSSAIAHLAQVQGAGSGASDARQRRDQLFGVLDKITSRAQDVAKRELPIVKAHGYGRVREELSSKVSAEDADYLSLTALSRDLVGLRNWSMKLSFLIDILERETNLDPTAVGQVDDAISDILASPLVIQDTLGHQPNLSAAIITLADLADGKMDIGKRSSDDSIHKLNALFAAGRLPATRLVLLDWIRRQLRSNQPLNRHDPNEERSTFQKLLHRLVGSHGVTGGGPVAEGLVLRRLQFQSEGGAPGRQRAFDALLSELVTASDRVRFCVELLNSGLAMTMGDHIRSRLTAILGHPPGFIDTRRGARENLASVTALWRQVRDSSAPAADRAFVCESLDDILVQYIDHSRLVERLDDPTASLRYRAIRLIQLCASGDLESPRALDIARRRVIAHLRQPSFDEKFVADLNDASEKVSALKEFYGLLKRAGFR